VVGGERQAVDRTEAAALWSAAPDQGCGSVAPTNLDLVRSIYAS
jgi:hypothetical protein